MKYLKKFNEGSSYRIESETDYGKIISIEEIFDYFHTNYNHTNLMSQAGDGYKIVTDKFEIYIVIENQQNCCENFGYISSDDNFSEYTNATITGIIQTDDELNQKIISILQSVEGDECANTFFINIETTNGPIQFALYNSHNGYYGHNCCLFIENKLDSSKNITKSASI